MEENQAKIEQGALENMQKARSSLLLEHPFFATFALKLELKIDNTCSDLWTDGKTLAYNPMYAYSLSKESMIGAQAHEIMHLACGHHIRRNGREEKKWNEACDYAINSLLLDAGFKLPENFRYDVQYKNMSVDDIYQALLHFDEQQIHGGANQANIAEEVKNEDSEGSSGSLNNNSAQINKENETKKASTEEQNGENTEINQDIDTNNLNEDLESEKSQSMSTAFHGEVQDHPSLSDKDNENAQKFAEQESQIQLAQALQSAISSGNTPLGLLRLFKDQISPSLDWRELLQRFIENHREGDYSWSTPNRRYLYQNIYLPSRNEERLSSIVLAIDASGSIDMASLSLFCAELESILDFYDTTLHIVYHDNMVQGHQEYTRNDRPLVLTPKGGGGTDYRPVIQFIEEENLNPKALLWFTDLECAFFPEEPHFPLLWICTRQQNNAPYGDIIYIK